MVPSSAAVSPDGRNVYAAASDPGQIVVFKREQKTGALRQLAGAAGCISDSGLVIEGGVRCTRGRALAGAHTVVIAPGGRHVYVVGYTSVAVMRRNPQTGALRQLAGAAGCLNGSGDDGCAPARGLAHPPLYLAPTSITLTPDGRHAYVLASSGAESGMDFPAVDTIAVFRRNPATGVLSQPAGGVGCLMRLGLDGCTRARLLGAALVSIEPSPNGRHMYAGSDFGDAQDRLQPALQLLLRDRRSGALREVAGRSGCFAWWSGVKPCALLRGEGAGQVVVSGDGRHVYVGGYGLTAFGRRRATGALRQLRGSAGCITDEGGATCGRTRGLNGNDAMALSRDGQSLYVAAARSDSLAVFARARRSGRLLQLRGIRGCLAAGDRSEREHELTKGCAPVRGGFNPASIAISPDGKNVYMAARGSNSQFRPKPGTVTVFERTRPRR